MECWVSLLFQQQTLLCLIMSVFLWLSCWARLDPKVQLYVVQEPQLAEKYQSGGVKTDGCSMGKERRIVMLTTPVCLL